MIRQFLRGLGGAGLDIEAREAADILWLSRLLPVQERDDVASDPPPVPPQSDRKNPTDRGGQTTPATRTGRRTVVIAEFAAPGVYIPSQAHAGGTTRASAVRVPAASALPGAIEIARSLRPFMRRRPSRRVEFDPEATVERFADTSVLAPVLRAAKDRWFEIALVIDDGPSMVVWKETAAELHHLLIRHGAFRDVRRWTLAGADSGIGLVSESGLVQGWRELLDATSRRLILLFTDCVGARWEQPALWHAIAELGSTTPLVLVQVLPERLWPSTTVGPTSATVRNRYPGVPNALWETEQSGWDAAPEGAVPVPVVTLQPGSLEAWARVVMGGGGASAPAVHALAPRPHDDPIDPTRDALTPEQRLARYKEFVSPAAYQLAVYLSAVPLNLPVMRLVQRAMMPESRQVALAEFFLGGLIECLPSATASASDDVAYDFYPGVREHLQGSFTRTEVLRVLQAVSAYIEEHVGQPLDFRALIADPDGPYVLPEFAIPFATLGARLLARMGQAAEGTVAAPHPIEEEEYAPGLTIRKTFTASSTIREAAWSSDGALLALRCHDGVWVVDARTGELIRTRCLEGYSFGGVAWAPDRDLMVVGESADEFRLIFVGPRAVQSQRLRMRFANDLESRRGREPVTSVAWRPGSSIIAVRIGAESVLFWDSARETAESFRQLAGSGPAATAVAWSPDGRMLAAASTEVTLLSDTQTITLAGDRESGREHWLSGAVAWHPAGTLLAASTGPTDLAIWNVPERRVEQTLNAPMLRSLAFSRDGEFLAAECNGELVLWRTKTWKPMTRGVHAPTSSSPIAFSPVADELAIVENETVHILRLRRESLVPERVDREPSLPWRVFISYTQADRPFVTRLKARLDDLEREGLCEFMSIDDEASIENWQRSVAAQIGFADLFLPVITQSFLESTFAMSVWQGAIEALNERGLRMVPVIRETDLVLHTTFFHFPSLPRGNRPINDWLRESDFFARIVSGLRELIVPWATPEFLDRSNRATVRIQGAGGTFASGAIVDDYGHVVTAYHDAFDRMPTWVSTSDGRHLDARLIASDETIGLAVLELSEPGTATLSVRNAAGAPEAHEIVCAPGYQPDAAVERVFGTLNDPSAAPLRVSFGPTPQAAHAGSPIVNQAGDLVGVLSSRAFEGRYDCIRADTVATFLHDAIRLAAKDELRKYPPVKPDTVESDFTIDCFPTHGDCLLVEFGSTSDRHRILVDAGDAEDAIRHLAPRFNIPEPFTIDLAVATHLHERHLSGFRELLRRKVHVGTFVVNQIDSFMPRDSHFAAAEFSDKLESAAWKGTLMYGARLGLEIEAQARLSWTDVKKGLSAGATLSRNGLLITIVCPTASQIDQPRERLRRIESRISEHPILSTEDILAIEEYLRRISALAMLLKYGQRRVLLTSDAYADHILEGLEVANLMNDRHMHVDLLQLPAHGSPAHLNDDLLRRVTADHYLITGAENGADAARAQESLRRVRAQAAFEVHVVRDAPVRIDLPSPSSPSTAQ